MRRLALALTLLTSGFAFASPDAKVSAGKSDDTVEGIMFVHTVRPKFSHANISKIRETIAKKDGFEKKPARGFEFKNEAGDLGSFVFSNRLAMTAIGAAEFKVEHFTMKLSDIGNKYADNSKLVLSAKSGIFEFYNPDYADISFYEIKTPRGIYQINGTEAELKISKHSETLVVLNGHASFEGKNGEKEFINKRQILQINDAGKKFDTLMTMEEETLKRRQKSARVAVKTVRFTVVNGEIQAKKSVSVDFVNDREN